MGRSSTWPWVVLAVALVATTTVRLPMILNARSHLDSDLAVDGLTLQEALHGHWRWHYPGTPHVGTSSLVLMLPIGLIRGATPESLAISGAILWALVVVSTFVLALRVFSAHVAAWSLVPLAFCSTGMIWLSGRITGSHLLAVTWHAVAFLLLYEWLTRDGLRRAAFLGVWCGLGIWNDSMMLMSLAGLIPAGLAARIVGRSAPRVSSPAGPVEEVRTPEVNKARIGPVVLVLGLAFLVGLLPRFVGRWADPFDAYNEQLAPIWKRDVLFDHARILALDCLPRLIVGHRLPDLQAEPGGIGEDGRPIPAVGAIGPVSIAVVMLGFALFPLAIGGLALRHRDEDETAGVVRWGLLVSTLAMLAGFVVNRNIFNSDNYRYLVLMLVPWSVGFGRMMVWLWRRGQGGRAAAFLMGITFAIVFVLDAAAWYRRLGWLDERGRPIARRVEDPIFAWFADHPEVNSLGGDYWDVYRYAFLRGGGLRGVPSSHYPDRLPEWSRDLPGGHPSHVVARVTPIGAAVLDRARRDGGSILYRGRAGTIVSWPASGR